jgi:hypothetical protein
VRSWRRVVAGLTWILSLAACGGGASETPGVAAPAVFATFQEADVVFGQQIFAFHDANQGAPLPGPGTLACPGIPAVGPLFVPDIDNHRVLGFAQAPILNNLEANFVLGQADFDFASPGVGATAMRGPSAAFVGAGRLLVADTGNHRVLIYAGVPDSRGAGAAVALGQVDLFTAAPGQGASGLNGPTGLTVAAGRVIVTDRLNHRVLIWNRIPTVSGTPADLVLGQADFESVRLNRGGIIGPATLFDPYGVWSDGERLVVADRGNHRVLIWGRFPHVNGQPADLVLGQPDGVSREARAGSTGLDRPCGVYGVGERLFVADAGNHRVLLWDAFPQANGASADGVLGQSDFDHRAPNDTDQDGTEDTDSSARTLKGKNGVLTVGMASGTLFVGDAGNHRLLVFRGQ